MRAISTPCHEQHGCIRAFDDDTCGDAGQCSIVLAIMAEREACAKAVEAFPQFLPMTDQEVEEHGTFARQASRKDIADAIREGTA